MNSNWRNRPTTVDEVSKDIDYIISIDESGTPGLKQVLKAKKNGTEVKDEEKHFTIAACLIKMSDCETARDTVMNVKRKYWTNALFDYKGIKKRICFHSREIRGKEGAFNPQIIDYSSFISDLSQMMSDIPITLYASHIDKVCHVNQYSFPASPYDLCMTFVLERIVRDIPESASCIIILEARGFKDDKELLNQIKETIDLGTQYCPAATFKKIKGVYFNSKWCRDAKDQMSYWELELADLCVYPIQKYFMYNTKDKAFKTLLPKISGYPNYWGKGLKSFP